MKFVHFVQLFFSGGQARCNICDESWGVFSNLIRTDHVILCRTALTEYVRCHIVAAYRFPHHAFFKVDRMTIVSRSLRYEQCNIAAHLFVCSATRTRKETSLSVVRRALSGVMLYTQARGAYITAAKDSCRLHGLHLGIFTKNIVGTFL